MELARVRTALLRPLPVQISAAVAVSVFASASASFSICLSPVCRRLLLAVGLKCLLPRSGRYGSYPHNPPVLVPGLDHALVYNFAGDNVRRHNATRTSRR